MKKLILLAVAMLLVVSSNTFASNADLFSYDEQSMTEMFADLNELEAYVASNNDVSAAALNPFGFLGEPPLGVPSFLWGCVFGVVGLAIVYFVAEDPVETKKALWGCVTSSVVGILFYFVLWGVLFTTAASATTI
jgi:hypothetical protein